MDPRPSPERLHELFVYNPLTGTLHWRNTMKEAGTLKDGYLRVCLRRGSFQYAHRIIWAMHYLEWPAGVVDHINGARRDNRLANLRHVSLSENSQNMRRAHRDNPLPLGVSWRGDRSKWVAQIRVDGKNKYLGLFGSPEAAHQAYLNAKRIYHKGNTL